MPTEEELKNMSPEQIAELQKQNCIFCHIISGKAPAKKIYEDDKCIALLDINPANLGHILLIPKTHAMVMPQLSDDEIKHLGIISKKLSHACLKALKAQGTNIFVANGAIAGQKAPHFMIHIIPRKDGDGVTGLDVPAKQANENDLQQIYDALKKKINELFGIKDEPKPDQSKIEKKIEEKPIAPKEVEAEIVKEEEKRTEELKKEIKKEEAEETKKKKEEKVDLDKIANMFLK